MTAPVVVGIDDIEHSRHAVALAAREAELRGAPLWIGHAYQWVPPVAAGITPGGDTAEGAVRDVATALLAEALKQVQAEHPDLDVHTYAMSGRPAPELAALAGEASLLVLGRHGRGGFAGMLLGSVVLRTTAHARCPVLVAHEDARAKDQVENQVLVGVDVADSGGGPALLDFAFEEAALRGAGLVALHVWDDPGRIYPDQMGDYTWDHLAALDAESRDALAAALAPWRDKYPDVPVEARVQGGSPTGPLVAAGEAAELLVIGARTRSAGEGLRLGALAYTLLHHAPCPVAVVPEHHDR